MDKLDSGIVIDHDRQHLRLEGRPSEFQEYLISGMEPIEEAPSDNLHKSVEVLRHINNQLDRTLVAVPFQGVPTVAPNNVYKGRNLYGTQLISGQGRLAGWDFFLDNIGQASASEVVLYIFDGNDSSGVLIGGGEISTTTTSAAAGIATEPLSLFPFPVKFYNGLYVALASITPATMIPLARGTFYTVHE